MGRGTPKKQNSSNSNSTQQQQQAGSASSPARSSTPKLALDGYQKRLESLIADLARLRRSWNALVLVDGLRTAQKIVKGRQEAFTSAAKASVDQDIQQLYLIKSLTKVETDSCKLADVLVDLDDAHRQMKNIETRAYSLLTEVSRAKGTDFAFQSPFWPSSPLATWSLAHYAEHVSAIVTSYTSALQLHQSLFDSLMRYTEEAQPQSKPDKAAETSQADVQQANLSIWAAQPCLDNDAELFLDQVCKMEVYKWS